MTWWDGFWKPDPEWLATVNTTNLRSVTGLRLCVWLIVLGSGAFTWALSQAIPYCGGGPCKESLSQVRYVEFAVTIYDSMLLFGATLVGIAVGAYLGKRTTDTGHRVAVEEAKKAPVLPAPPPAPPATIIARDRSTVINEAEADAAPASPPAAVSEAPPTLPSVPRPTGDARVDDERGEM